MVHSTLPTLTSAATLGTGATWWPLLEGTLKQRALEVVADIAASLRQPPPVCIPPELRVSGQRAAVEASLSEGAAGLAVLYGYLAKVRSSHDDEATAVRFLEQAVEAVAATPMGAALYGGFTGVAWAAHWLDWLIAPEAGDPNEDIDEALEALLRQASWQGPYDLIGGLVGFGVYALERLPRPAAVQSLRRVLDHLHLTAEQGPAGVRWFTPPELLSAWQRERCPQGHYNLGLAHGIPGVIAFLGRVYAAGVASLKVRRLLERAVSWLLTQAPVDGEMAGLPSWVGPHITPRAAQSAWCYGDPGVAAALLGAARCTGEPAWERAARALARRAAERPPDRAGVVDTCLCHGTAGLGHLFNRMFQATGDPLLGDAARFWLERTLDLRRPGQGIAGFLFWGPDEAGNEAWVADRGLLTGAAGVALSLLAATTAVEPTWDRMLLVSIPRRGVGNSCTGVSALGSP